MNPEDSHHEIETLLRANRPQVHAPPGLEARILRSLEEPEPSWMSRFWPWLLLPPAVAMSATLLLQPSQRKEIPPVTRHNPPPVEIVEQPVSPIARWKNPLETESLALQRDMRRASQFLINSLPALPTLAE
ncbi:MAG: hypothetical protein EOP87_16680 [Verrucomicrobiaceae bacterium]|nr:MAG: hypothetical protein EOP87_16680 [Verrucomicrobiaceae bacterium]